MANDCCNNAHTRMACGLNLDGWKSGQGLRPAVCLYDSAPPHAHPMPLRTGDIPAEI